MEELFIKIRDLQQVVRPIYRLHEELEPANLGNIRFIMDNNILINKVIEATSLTFTDHAASQTSHPPYKDHLALAYSIQDINNQAKRLKTTFRRAVFEAALNGEVQENLLATLNRASCNLILSINQVISKNQTIVESSVKLQLTY